VILGPAGAGKTRLAWLLAERTGLPVVHLDVLHWRTGWNLAPLDEARAAVAKATDEPRWAMDGNFLGLGLDDPRFGRADTVVFLDVRRARCFWRVLSRAVRDRRRTRPDLPDGCREGFDLPLLRWMWRYPVDNRPQALELLDRLRERGVAVHHLRSKADVRQFLDG
jgi:adenylate kinase family enzyme